jgi:hypothetical protein
MWKESVGSSQRVVRDSVCVVCSSAGREAKGHVGLPNAGGNFENKENWNMLKYTVLYYITCRGMEGILENYRGSGDDSREEDIK